MAEYIRKQYHTLKARIDEPRRFIQVLAGPRQVGKTTLVAQLVKNINIPFTLENADGIAPNNKEWIHQVWESVRVNMQIHHHTTHLLVIDEVQKLENWSEQVKAEWDRDTMEDRQLKVVLLGSSRLLLKKGLTESLAGRFELIRVTHWSYSEMRDAFGFTLDQYIYYGGYPGPAHMVGEERRWRKYIKDALVAPAIEKDVILTSNIYKPALMKQTFELGCAYSAELLSLTKMIGQLQDAGNVTTLASYVDILSSCALLTGLQKYAADTARKYNSIPKFQVYNNALPTTYKGRSFTKDRMETAVWGRWVESAVGAYLVSQAEELDYKVYYWREKEHEVDFILVADETVIAIEVKSGRRSMNSGLPAFSRLFHPTRTLVVGTGGLSLEDFFATDLSRLIEALRG